MLNITETPINIEEAYNKPESQQSSNYVAIANVNQYLTTAKDQHTINSSESPYSVVYITDHSSSITPSGEECVDAKSDDYILMVETSQDLLDNALLSKNKSKVEQAIKLIANNNMYPHLLLDIINSYLIQNNTATLKTLFFDYNHYTENMLSCLLKDQLNNEQNMELIDKLINVGAKFTVEDLELLLQSTDDNLKKQQLEILESAELLHDIVNQAVYLNKLDLIKKLHFTHCFATLKSCDYLLADLFSNEFSLELFNHLIVSGAKVKKSTLDKLVLSENTNQINNIATVLTKHKLYNKVLNTILDLAIKHNKVAIIQMLYTQYNFFTDVSLNYLLLHNLNDTSNIDILNELIGLGATLTNSDLTQWLYYCAESMADEQFLDFYIKLEQINFSQTFKDTIRLCFQQILLNTRNISVTGDDLNTIGPLYFYYGYITPSTLGYILKHEPRPDVRLYAEIVFERKYQYKKQLNDIANNL